MTINRADVRFYRMKFILIFACLLFELNAFGQIHSLGLQFGPTIAQTDRETYDYYKPLLGITGSGFYDYQQNHFAAKTSLGLIQRGLSQELIYVDSAGNILGQGAVENIKHTYLHFTQTIGLRYGERFYVGFFVGLRVGYYFNTRIYAQPFFLDDGQQLSGYSYTFDNLQKVDLTALAEGEFGLKIDESRSGFIAINYDRSLLNVDYQNGIGAGIPWKYQNISIQVGVKYRLGI
jgi:hypothetical protein